MNWIKENKFLAIFIAVMVVGVGVLGYLLYSSSDQFDQVSSSYTSQAAQLNQLQGLTPSRTEDNLAKVKQQKDEYVKQIAGLQDKVAGMQFPVEDMTPSSFQSALKDAVNDTEAKATASGVKLPEGFYLGFQDYQSVPPRNEAASALGQQLKAIKLVVDALITSRISQITAIARDPLPQESKVQAQPADAAVPRPPVPAGGQADESKLLTKETFQVAFSADQAKFQQALNAISSADEQFIIVRNLRLHNDQIKGPSRIKPVTATAATAQVALDASGQPIADDSQKNDWLQPIVGREKVNVTLSLEIIDFAKSAGKTAAK
ncbi:MAG: Amuc_1100 family pilus-like protein [Chthoniobacteraceae bacterium]